MPGVKTAAFVTLGCKINQYETEAIREEILDLGYDEVPFSSAADVYVVNTCSVTATSGVKSRRYVQRAARANPTARILVVGCSSPAEKAQLARIPQVAVLAGNEEKAVVSGFLNGTWEPGAPVERDRADIFHLRISRSHRTRANVKVQDGCNNFCSFCIIPFLRGRSQSRCPGEVCDEVRRLTAQGHQEVVLTGVHLQDYSYEPKGGALAQEAGTAVTLAALLRQVAAVEGLRRVRLSSTNPRAFTSEVLDVLSDPIFCPHWHIPLQAGSDAVLEYMRRDYRMDDYRNLVESLHARFEEPSIATDIIVGHPGETEADFERTLEAAREFGFSKIHVFPYSRREGTLAAKLGGDVPAEEIQERARRLRELDLELAQRYRRRFLGRTVEVLVEGEAVSRAPDLPARPSKGPQDDLAQPNRAPAGLLDGLTERYVRVEFPAPSTAAATRFSGTLQPVRLERLGAGREAAGRVRGSWGGEVLQ